MDDSRQLPDYAVFDDYRYGQRIAVIVRWFLVVTWLVLHNYRATLSIAYFTNNGLVLALSALNAYVHWRVWKGRPISARYALALSATDLVFLTIGIIAAGAFGNTFFVLYYPALLGLALVSPSRRLTFAGVTLVAIAYATLSISLDSGVSYADKEEKILIIRIASMFAVATAAHLMIRIERNRRLEAVEAERARARENLELQRKAQEAELATQRERDRIAREIHDGIAQSIYALSLNLETCAELAEREQGPLREQIQKLVPMAKKTLLESRHYIYDLKPLLSGETDLEAVAENQAKEFQMVAGTPVKLSVDGRPGEVPVAVATGFYRILQEALANVLKHASASEVNVTLSFEPGWVRLSVQDDGVGFVEDGVKPGYGLQNMRQRATELGGNFEISGAPEKGTILTVKLPAEGGGS